MIERPHSLSLSLSFSPSLSPHIRAALSDHGYSEKVDELDQATTFLHENGILLHFDDSSLLSDLYFLDPQWLCSNLAKVITVQQKNPFQKSGKFGVSV